MGSLSSEAKNQKDVPVNVKHAEGLDVVLAQDALLGHINVAQANVDQLAGVEAHVVGDPAKVLLALLAGDARQEGEGHAVDVAAVTVLGGVDVGVGVDPDDGRLAAQALARGLGDTADGADGDAVVATEG